MTPPIVGRDVWTKKPIRVSVEGNVIASVEPIDILGSGATALPWLAPAFWDLQNNGRFGVSFSDGDLTTDQVKLVVDAQAKFGTARVFPTLISASEEDLIRALRTLAKACAKSHEVGDMVAGVHLEGPYLSSLEGFRGAHRAEVLKDPDWDEFQRFQAASGGRIKILTLAPERTGAMAFIEKAAAAGVTIALGHTNADRETIQAAVSAGAKLSTHLGNGIAASLPRHPNPIWTQASNDRLYASVIGDGHHLDPDVLKVIVKAKGFERIILVSDASPLAGLSAGRYGDWEVLPEGKVVVAGTPYLAGANRSLLECLNFLVETTDSGIGEAIATVTTNPCRLLGLDEPTLRRGAPANVVVLRERSEHPRFVLEEMVLDGRIVALEAN